jgi:hypothetical protein
VRILEERGFRVPVEQDELLRGSVLFNLFAVRPGATAPAGARERQRRAFHRSLAEPASVPTLSKVRRAAPGSALERSLVQIWRQALRIESLGIDDDFFDLGGTSLTGLEIVHEIRRRLGVELSPVAVFAAPTVRNLACRLAAEAEKSAAVARDP